MNKNSCVSLKKNYWRKTLADGLKSTVFHRYIQRSDLTNSDVETTN